MGYVKGLTSEFLMKNWKRVKVILSSIATVYWYIYRKYEWMEKSVFDEKSEKWGIVSMVTVHFVLSRFVSIFRWGCGWGRERVRVVRTNCKETDCKGTKFDVAKWKVTKYRSSSKYWISRAKLKKYSIWGANSWGWICFLLIIVYK